MELRAELKFLVGAKNCHYAFSTVLTVLLQKTGWFEVLFSLSLISSVVPPPKSCIQLQIYFHVVHKLL